MQQALQIVSELWIRRRQRDRRRQTCRQLFREGRAGNHRQGDSVAQRFTGHVLQQAPGFRFQTFRRPYQASVGAHQRFNLPQHLAENVARHDDEDIAAGRQRGRQIAFQMQRVGERNVWKKCGVAAVVLQRRNMFRVMAPQHNVVAISCQGDGKSGAVRAGTDHSHCSVKRVHQAS